MSRFGGSTLWILPESGKKGVTRLVICSLHVGPIQAFILPANSDVGPCLCMVVCGVEFCSSAWLGPSADTGSVFQADGA